MTKSAQWPAAKARLDRLSAIGQSARKPMRRVGSDSHAAERVCDPEPAQRSEPTAMPRRLARQHGAAVAHARRDSQRGDLHQGSAGALRHGQPDAGAALRFERPAAVTGQDQRRGVSGAIGTGLYRAGSARAGRGIGAGGPAGVASVRQPRTGLVPDPQAPAVRPRQPDHRPGRYFRRPANRQRNPSGVSASGGGGRVHPGEFQSARQPERTDAHRRDFRGATGALLQAGVPPDAAPDDPESAS